MKRILFIATAALLSVPAFAQTQRFYQVSLFLNEVYLSDDTNTPLSSRLIGSGVSSVNSTNSNAGIQLIGGDIWLDVYNWSTIDPSQDLTLKGVSIKSVTNFYAGSTGSTSSDGTLQMGYSGDPSLTLSIGASAHGASQQGLFYDSVTIGAGCYGASQQGYLYGNIDINSAAMGARQSGYIRGNATISAAPGAHQMGYMITGASATNLGYGALQVLSLDPGEHALTTDDADGSVLIGRGTNKHDHAVLISDEPDAESKGIATIYATGGDWSDNYGSINNATGTPSHLMNRDALYTNFLRQTTFNPSSSSDSGAPYQSHLEPIDATSAWFSVYSGTSSLWYRVKLGTF